jgi:hypothetical protein
MTRVLLFQNNVPKIYWSCAVLTVIYLINRLPNIVLKNKSPLKILYQRKILIDHLRVFGCTCYVHNNIKNDKLDARAIKIFFLGNSSQKKGYNCYDPVNKIFYTSRDVIFQENEPYFKKLHNIEESCQ